MSWVWLSHLYMLICHLYIIVFEVFFYYMHVTLSLADDGQCGMLTKPSDGFLLIICVDAFN